MTLPALLGGSAIRPQGPPDWPPHDDAVAQALLAAHRDGSWGKYAGGRVEELEQRLAQMHGVRHALACGSGTFAVELALRALKVGPGDEGLLPAYASEGNFLSLHPAGPPPPARAAARGRGAGGPASRGRPPSLIGGAVGPRTRAVVVSHLHGGVVPM